LVKRKVSDQVGEKQYLVVQCEVLKYRCTIVFY
jgi:hypothetical protein